MARASDSQKKATKKWESKKDKILLRVPEGKREEIQKYVKEKAEVCKEGNKYTASRYTSYNGKYYIPSTSAYIINLIEQDSGIDLS